MADCTCGIAPSTIVAADSYTHFHCDHPGHSDGRIPASLLESIKTCSKLKDLYGGNRLHAVVIKQGLLDKDSYVGTALLHMYAKCGKLMKAVEVFDQLPERDVAAWNALITGYTQHGLGHEALGCFERMEVEGLTPSIITYVSLLKACGSIGALKKGARIHAEVQRLGILHTNAMIGTALVDMYAKCGALDKAQAVFDEFPIRALATWNALLFGYAEQGLLNEALSLFQHMQEEGLSPDAITYVCMLKVCTNARSIERGIEIHTELSKKHMLENNVIIGTALIEMYANCGALDKAQEVFDKLQKKDVACWTALIGGFARHGIGDKSINCYIRMQEEGFSPSAITLVFVLSACGSSQAIEMGQLVHAEIRKQRAFAENTLIANALVDMYFKCSDVQKAKEVFDEIPIKITGSWNTLITGYVDHGLAEEALKCFENMQDNGFLPDAITFICILKACSELKALEKGEKVHAEVSKLGLLKNHIVLGNALVDMYIKCNMLERAKEVFEKVLSRDVTSWNVLIAGYAQHKFNDKAMECFGQMLSEGISPNSITFQSALKACGSVGALQKGKELHGRVGMISSCNRINGLVNALMDMYAQCGAFENAWELFRELQTRDVASWNILISGYVQHGFGSEALDCFARMQKDDVFPNVVTYVNILKACSAIGEVKKGEEIHMEIERLGLLNEHYILGTALVDMYAKHGLIEKSQEVFDKLLLRDAVCWTALINGYAQLGLGDEALCRYGQMQDEGVFPETVTYACILKACSTIGALKRAEDIHSEVGRMGLLEKDSMLGNALLDMYVKCGEISRAQEVFSMLPMRDAFSWTSLISGYAQFGEYRRVFSLFRKMEKEQIEPNIITFVVLLTACRHSGLLEEGKICFDVMHSVYHITPTLDHHVCMVDLFSRTGNFDIAICIIEQAPDTDSPLLWSALLGACQTWMNAELGKRVFECALQLDDNFGAADNSMSNIYAALGMYNAG